MYVMVVELGVLAEDITVAVRAVSESFACTWDSLPSIGLLHPALALGDVLSLTAA